MLMVWMQDLGLVKAVKDLRHWENKKPFYNSWLQLRFGQDVY
jgi:hypothetical protein